MLALQNFVAKFLSLTLTLSMLVCTINAQVKYGIKAGGNVASVRYIEEDISRARLGVHAGVAVEAAIAPQVFVRPELLYTSKGFGFKATAANMAGSQRLNYISVPVLLGYYATERLSFLAGPEFSYLRKAVARSQGITTDYTNFYRRFDMGVNVGVAYNLNSQFSLEGRYTHGFKDLVNTIYTDNTGNLTGQGKNGANRVLQFGVVWWLSE
jgi:hypothetical protein